MIELRGDPIAPLRSWTREQTLARERYRVIAVFAEADRAQAAAMEPLLGPNDELLPVQDRSFPALMNAGTARARTPWLVMTEGQCIAQPGSLDEVMRWIEANPDARVGNFELIHVSRNIVNRMVARWYDQTLAQWRTPPNWEHTISAGFAIRASVLDEAGPMEPAFGAFSPHVQSALLHSRGVKVANVPGAAVIHLDERSMTQFYDSTERYARGEFTARSQIDSAFMERYFGDPHLWTNRARLKRGTARAMTRAVAVAVRTSPRRVRRPRRRVCVLARRGRLRPPPADRPEPSHARNLCDGHRTASDAGPNALSAFPALAPARRARCATAMAARKSDAAGRRTRRGPPRGR
jgi:hypothetical protein